MSRYLPFVLLICVLNFVPNLCVPNNNFLLPQFMSVARTRSNASWTIHCYLRAGRRHTPCCKPAKTFWYILLLSNYLKYKYKDKDPRQIHRQWHGQRHKKWHKQRQWQKHLHNQRQRHRENDTNKDKDKDILLQPGKNSMSLSVARLDTFSTPHQLDREN